MSRCGRFHEFREHHGTHPTYPCRQCTEPLQIRCTFSGLPRFPKIPLAQHFEYPHPNHGSHCPRSPRTSWHSTPCRRHRRCHRRDRNLSCDKCRTEIKLIQGAEARHILLGKRAGGLVGRVVRVLCRTDDDVQEAKQANYPNVCARGVKKQGAIYTTTCRRCPLKYSAQRAWASDRPKVCASNYVIHRRSSLTHRRGCCRGQPPEGAPIAPGRRSAS